MPKTSFDKDTQKIPQKKINSKTSNPSVNKIKRKSNSART